MTPGVETTTGPLGQGFANGVGLAVAERWLAAQFNRPGHPLVNHCTYAIVSDGDLMEGVASEAASLAGHLKLGKLILPLRRQPHLNRRQHEPRLHGGRRPALRGLWLAGPAGGRRNDLGAVESAIRAAQAEVERPSLILCRTHIGFGSPNKQDSSKAHGEPLGEEELRLTKQKLGWPLEPAFLVPDEARQEFRKALERGKAWEAEWEMRAAAYAAAFPQEKHAGTRA